MGSDVVAPSTCVLRRKRWPSAETSNGERVPVAWARVTNSGRTAPTSKWGPSPFTAAAISVLSGDRDLHTVFPGYAGGPEKFCGLIRA